MIHLFINGTFLTYSIIHKFMDKNKGKIKKVLKDLDEELIKSV